MLAANLNLRVCSLRYLFGILFSSVPLEERRREKTSWRHLDAPCRRRAAEQRDELAPSHVLLSAEVLKTITAPEEISRCAAQQIQAA